MFSTPASDDCSTLRKQITSELDKYLQEAAERHEVEDNYFDGCPKFTNTSPFQQEDYYLKEDDINIDNASLNQLYRSLMSKTPAYIISILPIARLNHKTIWPQFLKKKRKKIYRPSRTRHCTVRF